MNMVSYNILLSSSTMNMFSLVSQFSCSSKTIHQGLAENSELRPVRKISPRPYRSSSWWPRLTAIRRSCGDLVWLSRLSVVQSAWWLVVYICCFCYVLFPFFVFLGLFHSFSLLVGWQVGWVLQIGWVCWFKLGWVGWICWALLCRLLAWFD